MKITHYDFGLILHSLIVLLLVSLSLTGAGDISIVSLVLVLWGLLFFTGFYVLGQKARPLPPADAVTSLRLLLGILFLPSGKVGPYGTGFGPCNGFFD